MIIGDNAYDVVPGFIGAPIGSFAEHRAQGESSPNLGPASAANSDEELLAQFLMQNLE
jgi:hypothetical protein